MSAMTGWEAALAIAGMGVITLLTRAFFLLPEREWPLPAWLQKGLRYAPLAALAAVVMPEVLMTHGQLVSRWTDPKLAATAVGVAVFLWRRDILSTIVAGTGVMLALRLGLGW